MDTEKENSQTETPSSSVDAENDSHRHKQEPEEKNDEPCDDQEHTEKPPPVEADSEAKPDEEDGRTRSDDHLQEDQGEKASGGDNENEGEEEATTKNEDGEEEPELPPDLSKVSEEVDQYISDNNTFLESRGGGDDESPKSSPDDVPIFVEQFASLVEDKLEGYNSGEAAMKWSQLEEEAAAKLLEAVNRICRLYKSLSQFSSEQKYAQSISRIGGVLHRAMCYLEEEFRSYLDDYKFPDPAELNKQQQQQAADPDAGNEETQENSAEEDSKSDKQAPEEETIDFPGYPEETLSNLKRLAKAMTFGGYETECWQVYFVARRNALEESLRKVGYEGHSIDDVQKMSWEIVEREISVWIASFKHCASVLFPCERKLSEAVFNDCPELSMSSESIFTGLSGGLVIQFLIFPEAVAMTKRSAEKLFKFLDLYEAMRDHLPTMYINFPTEYVNELKAEAALTRGRLGVAMVGIFTELENSIKADSGKTPVPGGAVHPLTRYTMNYLKLAGDYKETLEQVFREHQKIERADSATGSDFDYNSQPVQSYKPPTAPKQSPFELQITKVMELLDVNLDNKSKVYKDLSLCSIFMMNNGRYILQKVRGSPQINQLMGDQWVRRRSSDLRQYHKTYQRETWGRLLQCLNIEGLNVHGKVNKPVLKERFKSFNAVFDEIHRTQSTWIISDEQLQSELRVSISNMVIPAYRSFLARYSQIFTPGRQTEKYVKYQPEDIETYIDELFDGNARK